MKPNITALLAGAVLVLAGRAAAAPMLTVVADSADPNNIAVGQVVQFDVKLSGLNPGDQLDYLAATVTFPTSLLGAATIPLAGSIIPDPTGFSSDVSPEGPDAFYDAVFPTAHTPISAIGTFFTFEVTAQAPGSGELTFDPLSLAASDGTNIPITLDAGPPLPFQVVGTAAVPEPASLALALAALAVVGSARLRARLQALTARMLVPATE